MLPGTPDFDFVTRSDGPQISSLVPPPGCRSPLAHGLTKDMSCSENGGLQKAPSNAHTQSQAPGAKLRFLGLSQAPQGHSQPHVISEALEQPLWEGGVWTCWSLHGQDPKGQSCSAPVSAQLQMA
jgi:hypothetical protein